MKLNAAQNRIIRSKPFGLNIVKGATSTGKTTAAVYRMLFLKNSYCLYEEDGILAVGYNDISTEYIRGLYETFEEESRFDYFTLLSGINDKVHIVTLDDIIHNYSDEYMRSKKVDYIVVDNDGKNKLISNCIEEIKTRNKGIKILDSAYLKFFLEEISWIKACGFGSLEEYQNSDRTGRRYAKGEGPQRLSKNSKERKAIYDLLLLYNKTLKENILVDSEDISDMALKQARKKGAKRYAHVIVDECEKLTKTQLELIKTLCSDRVYSSMMLLINSEYKDGNSINAWFVKGRKYNTLGTNTTGKTYSLAARFEDIVQEELRPAEEVSEVFDTKDEGVKEMEENNSISSSVEKYEYHDIRHFRKYDFIRDPDRIDELVVRNGSEDEEYSKDYLKELPVYSDIAAGEPILMSSELEANFYLPQSWFRGINDCFILKVKGDSMRDANIHDGDFIVIRKQHTAQNHDIVAVDLEGSATLKRLSLGKGGATLMPENPKYSPIPLYGREATILGIAVGLIKNTSVS